MPLRPTTPSRLLDLFGLAVALASVAYLAADVGRNLRAVRGLGDWSGRALLVMVAAAAAYLVAHLVRALRLWLILGADRLRFATVLGYHASIAFVTFATPFKLGDALRATELYRLLGDDPRGFFVVWLDRLFDVAVILALMAAMALFTPPDQAAMLVFASLGAFLLGSILAVVLLPGATSAFIRSLLQSSSGRSMRLLRRMVTLRDVLSRVPSLDGRTLSLLVLLTIAVWGLELATLFLVAIAMPGAGESLAAQGVGMLGYTILGAAGELTPQVALYRLVCVATLLAMLVVWAAGYVRSRAEIIGQGPSQKPYRLTPLFLTRRPEIGRRVR
jgi:hypothetical protein